MRSIFTIILSVSLFSSAFAGTSASASQTIQLIIAPTIEINTVQIKGDINRSFTVKSNENLKVTASPISNDHDAVANTKSIFTHRTEDQTFAADLRTNNKTGVVYTATKP